MSILIDEKTRVLIQGVTGKEGSFWAKHMKRCNFVYADGHASSDPFHIAASNYYQHVLQQKTITNGQEIKVYVWDNFSSPVYKTVKIKE